MQKNRGLCRLLLLQLFLLCDFTSLTPGLAARGNFSTPLEDVGIAVYQDQANFQLSPLYYAQVNGLYTEQGIRLTIYYAGSVEEVLRLLEQGRVHGALLPAVSIVRAVYQDRQIGIFMQYMHQSPYAVVAASSPKLTDPRYLVGKRIGFEVANYEARLAIQLFLKRYGLRDRVELVQTPIDPVNALLNLNLDAAITNRIQVPGLLDGQEFPYFLWQVHRKGDQVLPGDAFVAMRSYLSEQNRALLHRFARATLKGMQVLVRSPDRAAWDVVLPYEREFSVSQIHILQKELRLLGTYILGQQHFSMLGTATTAEYQFLLEKMLEGEMIRDVIPARRLFVF